MSDELDRAIDAQIDAYRPATVPPFSAMERRRRDRDRRRVIVAGTVLPLVVAGLTVAVVPSLGADGDRLTPRPGPAAGPGFAQEDLPPDATVVGTANVEGALTDPADPEYLVLSVAGAGEVPQDDPCWEGYRASATEDGTKIVVDVERLQRVAVNVGKACLGVGGTRTLGLQLSSPVGDRQIQDANSGATIRPFAGSRLLVPSYLPPGYQETAKPGIGSDGTWLRLFVGPADTSPITVKQEFGQQPSPPEPRATVESRPTVNGRPATVYIVVGPDRVDRRTVNWTVDGQTLTVDSNSSAPSVGPVAAEELLRLARGLREPPRK